MMKAFMVGVLGMMFCFFAASPATSQEDPGVSQVDPAAPPEQPAVSVENALPGDEVRKLFEGNTESGEGRKGEVDTGRRWTAFYDQDGTVRKLEAKDGSVKRGTWFVDSDGRNCFQYEGKDEPKCDSIVPQDGQYLRFRGGQARGRIRIQEGNPSNL